MKIAGFVLPLLSGIAWTIVYISIIRAGFRDKTYGMPLIALALNFAWEALYTYVGLAEDIGNLQSWVNLVWCLFDAVIIYTYFKYGREDFEKYGEGKYFIPWTILIFIMAFAVQYGFSITEPPFGFGIANTPRVAEMRTFLNPNLGCWYSAFTQNLVMSILYINMLALRKSTRGQNQVIAVSKWLGTLAPTIMFGILLENRLVLIMGFFCCLFDIIYIWMLRRHQLKETGGR